MNETEETWIGPYRIVERIAMGGQAEIHRAVREGSPPITVAIKVLHPGLCSESARRSFEREAFLLSRLDHPFIPRLIDRGDGERPWIAMEYVEGGEPIDRACERWRPTLRARLQLVIATCEAVQHAHDRGVLHLDIKPENVLVVEEARELSPRLVDFGIARPDGGSAPLPGVTSVGSLGSRSPEQAAGAADLDTRTDVFALGCLLARIIEPERESTALEANSRTRELEWIVEKATRFDRRSRYGSPRELADDLRRYAKGFPLQAAPPSFLYRLSRAIDRHRRAFVFLLVVLSSLSLAWILVWNEARAARIAAEEAARWAHRAQREMRHLENRTLAQLTIGLRERAATLWPLDAQRLDPLTAWLTEARRVADLLPELVAAQEGPGSRTLDELRRFVTAPRPSFLGTSLAGTTLPEVSWRAERLRDAVRTANEHADLFQAAGLPPQVGLLPLRRDPRSGCHEFAHLATGEPPEFAGEGDYVRGPRTGVVLVLIPGSDSRAPLLVSKYELTQAQWWRLTGSNPSQYVASEGTREGWNHPVEMVSGTECVSTLARVGLALPSGDDWVFAAGAGRTEGWCFGSDASLLRSHANVRDRTAHENSSNQEPNHEPWNDGHAAHAPVGSFLPNTYGLHDVHGNVAEWCADRIPSDLCTDSPRRKALIMGGSWYRDGQAAALDVRDHVHDDTHWSSVGVRPVWRVESSGSSRR